MTPSRHEVNHALASIEAASAPMSEAERVYWYEETQLAYRHFARERDLRQRAERDRGWLLCAIVIAFGLGLLLRSLP